jgi:hypothetical protein
MGAALVIFSGGSAAVAADQCLTASELSEYGCMASVMGLGAALRKCAACLGPDRYARTLQHYDAAGLMRDFWRAQASVKGREKIEYVDTIVRQSARQYSETLSGTCEACNRAAEVLDGLSSEPSRRTYYAAQGNELGRSAGVSACP